jgi:hypothetical protein
MRARPDITISLCFHKRLTAYTSVTVQIRGYYQDKDYSLLNAGGGYIDLS